MPDLAVTLNFKFQKGIAQPYTAAPTFNGLTVGSKAIENTINVQGSDISLDLGSLSSIGDSFFYNLAQLVPPPATDPVITQAGAAGGTQVDYILVFHYGDGSLSISRQVSTVLANATLDGTNYDILTWTNPASVTSVDVYRVVASGTPSTLGKIATA